MRAAKRRYRGTALYWAVPGHGAVPGGTEARRCTGHGAVLHRHETPECPSARDETHEMHDGNPTGDSASDGDAQCEGRVLIGSDCLPHQVCTATVELIALDCA
jgi:hypothetical protein